MVTRSLTLLAAACLVTAAFANGVVNPTKMPNVPTKHVHVTVGPDGIGRVDGGVGVQASSTKLPLYSNINAGPEGDSGFFFPNAESWADGIPILAPAKINEIVVWYYDNNGGPTSTVDLDLTIWDASADQAGDIYSKGCTAWGGLALGAYTVQGLPRDNAFSWIVTVDVSALPTVVSGRVWVQHRYYNHQGPGAGNTGPILMNGGDGAPLGRYVQWTGKTSFDVQGSPTNSDNVMIRLSDNRCYWFGGVPRANFAYSFNGQYAFRGELAGDFGLLGSVPQFPQNTCYVTVTDSSGFAETNLVYLYGPNGNEFSLPFDNTGPYDIRVEAFNGYLSRSLFGVAPDPVGFTATGVFNLRSGDANGDNTVNIADLNTVLINFGQSGN